LGAEQTVGLGFWTRLFGDALLELDADREPAFGRELSLSSFDLRDSLMGGVEPTCGGREELSEWLAVDIGLWRDASSIRKSPSEED
jgi:hypothetical protein